MRDYWSPEETALLLRVYPTMPYDEILRLFPRYTRRAIQNKAIRLGVRRLTANEACRTEMLRLAPNGYQNADIKGFSAVVVKKACSDLVAEGKVFIARYGTSAGTYFDTPEKARALRNLLANKPTSTESWKRKSAVTPKPKHRPGWGPNDPMHIPKGVKVQKCPSPAYALKTNTYPIW